jgi:hypothetical protein
MARKAIKSKEADQNGSAETENKQLTTQEIKIEVVNTPTLVELEAEVESAYSACQNAGWQWAVAVTRIHDSKLYPHADESGGFYTYMEERWGIKKAQAANYVAWVKQEIKLQVMLLDYDESTKVDSLATPAPAKPKHKSVTKARNARSGSRGTGFKYYVVTKEDGKWSTKTVSAKTAKDKGLTTFSNLAEAEQLLERILKQEEEQAQEAQTVTRPTVELNQKDVALTPAESKDENIPTDEEITCVEETLVEALADALTLLGLERVMEIVKKTTSSFAAA